jgi:translation initiation factor 1 (eIF-1/SUI1)
MAEQKKFRSLEDLHQISNSTLLPPLPTIQQHDGKEKVVHVTLDTHGRKGKCVTIVSGLQHNPTTLADIARILKQYCGAGGRGKD